MSKANDLNRLLAGGLAVMIIKVCQADRRDENSKAPAQSHGDNFHYEHEDGINEKHISSHDEVDNAFIYKARVRV